MFKDKFVPPDGWRLVKVLPNYIIGELVKEFLKSEGFHPRLVSSPIPYTDPVYMGRGVSVYLIVPEEEYIEVIKVLEESEFE
ncbi:MAG: 2-oxoglutarate:ferredoxin oxidoreductase [Dictyoglomus sp.]|nr:2-oxoglutarate:ferredoxin oxidoreductase [Dictyoglomus sp.]MCX7941651.1 2-oxoglutarate:ferredoxin oxidoreductase [Dictyoglomaceae bacterium]MDW8188197.1 2-oxoglutarate:ferredoxin oxidoreductase [Dictyoglomus sp.]